MKKHENILEELKQLITDICIQVYYSLFLLLLDNNICLISIADQHGWGWKVSLCCWSWRSWAQDFNTQRNNHESPSDTGDQVCWNIKQQQCPGECKTCAAVSCCAAVSQKYSLWREHGAHYKSSGADPHLHCVHSIIRLPSPFSGHVTSIVTNQRPISRSRDQHSDQSEAFRECCMSWHSS